MEIISFGATEYTTTLALFLMSQERKKIAVDHIMFLLIIKQPKLAMCGIFFPKLSSIISKKNAPFPPKFLLWQPSLETQLAQRIALFIMRRSKPSVSDFPCSDESKRTVSEGTRSCAEVMSFVIEDWKSPFDLIRYMFAQFSGFSPRNRSSHVRIDKRRFSNAPLWGIPRRIGG